MSTGPDRSGARASTSCLALSVPLRLDSRSDRYQQNTRLLVVQVGDATFSPWGAYTHE